MARPCKVCEHPEREAINGLLLSGLTIAAVAESYEVSRDSLERHRKNHLVPHQRETLSKDPELADVDPLRELRRLYHGLSLALDRADDANDWPAYLAFHKEARQSLELFAKLLGQIGGARISIDQCQQTIELHNSPEVLELRRALTAALEPYPEAKHAVIQALEARTRGELEAASALDGG